jgi:hypothetical protein
MRLNVMKAVKGFEELNFVKLESALLCANCELIVSETRNGKCPVCDSGALLGLSRLLGGPLHPPTADTDRQRPHLCSQNNTDHRCLPPGPSKPQSSPMVSA